MDMATKRKVKRVGGPVIIGLGVLMITFGIMSLVEAARLDSEADKLFGDFQQGGWWETVSASSDAMGRGMLLLIPGIFVTILGLTLRFGGWPDKPSGLLRRFRKRRCANCGAPIRVDAPECEYCDPG